METGNLNFVFLCSKKPFQNSKTINSNEAFRIEISHFRSTWVAQSVKHLTLAKVMISQFVGSSPTLGSVLMAQSLEPPSDSVSLLFLPFLYLLSVSLKNK